jgi:hypothetical protein
MVLGLLTNLFGRTVRGLEFNGQQGQITKRRQTW